MWVVAIPLERMELHLSTWSDKSGNAIRTFCSLWPQATSGLGLLVWVKGYRYHWNSHLRWNIKVMPIFVRFLRLGWMLETVLDPTGSVLVGKLQAGWVLIKIQKTQLEPDGLSNSTSWTSVSNADVHLPGCFPNIQLVRKELAIILKQNKEGKETMRVFFFLVLYHIEKIKPRELWRCMGKQWIRKKQDLFSGTVVWCYLKYYTVFSPFYTNCWVEFRER